MTNRSVSTSQESKIHFSSPSGRSGQTNNGESSTGFEGRQFHSRSNRDVFRSAMSSSGSMTDISSPLRSLPLRTPMA